MSNFLQGDVRELMHVLLKINIVEVVALRSHTLLALIPGKNTSSLYEIVRV